MKKLSFLKTLLVAVGLCAGVNGLWAEDVIVNIPISQSYNICGSNIAESQPITQLLITSAGGSYGEAQLEFLLDESFDASKVKSASLELYTVSNGTRSENVNIFSATGLTSNLSKKNCGDAKVASADGKAKIFAYGSGNTRSYGFLEGAVIASAAANTFTVNSYKSIDITSYIQGLTAKKPGDAIFFGIAATDTKPLAVQLAGYQHNNASKLVITYTDDVMYDYSIKAVCGTKVLKMYASGSCVSGTEFSANLNKVLKGDDGKYYVLNDGQTGVTGYFASFTMGENDGYREIAYTLDESIVWFEEGESNTATSTHGNSYSGCAHSDYRSQNKFNSTTITSAGAYKAEIYVASGIGNGRAFGIFTKDGETYNQVVFLNFKNNTSASYGLYNTDVFCVNSGTTLYTGNTANSLGIDYLIIRKVADIVDADNEFVGAFDCSSPYLGDVTEKVTLKPGDSYHYQFVNHNSGSGANWDNWVLPVYNSSDVEKIVVRADNFEVNDKTEAHKYGNNAGCSSNFDWTNFVSELNGATFDMTVSFTSDKVFTMVSNITTSTNKSWTYSYTSNYTDSPYDFTGDDFIKVALSVSYSWEEILSEGYTAVAATTGTNGYATFASPYPLDLSNLPTGLKAYKAAVDGTTVKFSEINQTVPANTGILIEDADKGEKTYSIPVAAEGTAVEGNAFLVNANGTVFDAESGYTYYGLMKNTLTFATFNPATVAIPANKAYLKVKVAAADARLNVIFDGEETTGIHSIDNGQFTIDDSVYNLNGQRITKPSKGMFIVNGKKVIMK